MADLGSPVLSGTGGFTPINRSPGNDSMSSGLPVQDDKKRRSEAQVAAVVTYDRPKASPEPFATSHFLQVQKPGAIVVAVCLLQAEF